MASCPVCVVHFLTPPFTTLVAVPGGLNESLQEVTHDCQATLAAIVSLCLGYCLISAESYQQNQIAQAKIENEILRFRMRGQVCNKARDQRTTKRIKQRSLSGARHVDRRAGAQSQFVEGMADCRDRFSRSMEIIIRPVLLSTCTITSRLQRPEKARNRTNSVSMSSLNPFEELP
jgi:hypothetical protein